MDNQSRSLRRIEQLPGHCGPATLEMLLCSNGIELIDQEKIGSATGIAPDVLKEEGARIDELSIALSRLLPEHIVLGKYESTVDDLVMCLEKYHIPVGVEWRGRFRAEDGGFFDAGHYSVVTGVNVVSSQVQIVDPENNSIYVMGLIPISEFIPRWWEIDDIPLEENTFISEQRKNRGLIFFVTHIHNIPMYREAGFEPVTLRLVQKHSRNVAPDPIVDGSSLTD